MKRVPDHRKWRCINCKTPATDDQEFCTRCGDRIGRRAEAQSDRSHTMPGQALTKGYQVSDEYAEELLTAALGYAAAGMAVFPLRLYVRGDGRKGVSPIANWDAASTTDPAVIAEWFQRAWRGTALAIDTGKSGLTVIDQDVDEGKDGAALWDSEGVPSLIRARTPTGGRHDYYRADPDRPVTVHNKGEIGHGIDVRSAGGFVIAPPTRDPRGGCWEWIA